jgi:DNA-binding response OmpR family regulator
MRLLLIEDDHRVASALADVLGRHGFTVRCAHGVARAAELLHEGADVALLDLGLPDGDGFELCRRIRAARDMPIIITTARSDLRSRVHGLHLGADDYIVKPYAVAELIARIHAVMRRTGRGGQADGGAGGEARLVHRRGVAIDLRRREVSVRGARISLTRKEFDVLAALARRPGLVLRREQLLSEVWGSSWNGDQHTLDVHVAAIRSKCGVAALVRTIRGVGYTLAEDEP